MAACKFLNSSPENVKVRDRLAKEWPWAWGLWLLGSSKDHAWTNISVFIAVRQIACGEGPVEGRRFQGSRVYFEAKNSG